MASMVNKLSKRGSKLHFCYEAGPTGYGLYRQIVELGHECAVVAPSAGDLPGIGSAALGSGELCPSLCTADTNRLVGPIDRTGRHIETGAGGRFRHSHHRSFAVGFSRIEACDQDTAIVLLHHDVDRETPFLAAALRSDAFYIGALGSHKSHQRRCQELRSRGFGDDIIGRIKAPIGIFPRARDSSSIALSVLADITAISTRRALENA